MARLPRTTSRCRDGLSKAEQFWSALRRLLGLGTGVREWDAVHAVIDGLATIDGVVDYLTPEFSESAATATCIDSYTHRVACRWRNTMISRRGQTGT